MAVETMLLSAEGYASIGTALVGSLGVYLIARFKAKRQEPSDLLRDSAALRQAFRDDNSELRTENKELRVANRELERQRDDMEDQLREMKKRIDDKESGDTNVW